MVLPKWVISNEASVAREARDYVGLTPSERATLVDLLCRDAATLIRARADGERALDHRDPLPEDSKRLLAALRDLERSRRAARG
jgi:hypothetical protein